MSGAYGGGMLALDLDRRVAALARLAAEYRYLPGLRLTTAQAARLCGLSIREVDVVLTALVVSGSCTERGTDGSAPWWKTSSTPRTALWTRS